MLQVDLSAYNKASLPDWARQFAKRQGGSLQPATCGIKSPEAKHLRGLGKPWVYFDHGYFKRGWGKGHFRAVIGDLHLTHLLDRPKDRMEKFEVVIEPWRKTGLEIIVIPPTTDQIAYYDNKDWYSATTARLDEITARPVITKWGKLSSLREFCANAWAVVTYASVAGVEASLMGIPVFCTERCPSWPVNAGPLERIETPEYSEVRAELAASLCYATWNDKEMGKVKWADYEYSLCG